MTRQALAFRIRSSTTSAKAFLAAPETGVAEWALALTGLCLALFIAANTLPALPLSNVISLAFAPVVAAATKSALNAKRSLAGVKPSAGG